MFMTGVLCTVCGAQVYFKIISWSKACFNNLWYHRNDLDIRNMHAK